MKEIKYRVYIKFTDETPTVRMEFEDKEDVKALCNSLKRHPKIGPINAYEFWEETKCISRELGIGPAPGWDGL